MTALSNLHSDCKIMEKNIPSLIIKVRKVLEEEFNILVPEKCDNFIARCLRIKDGNVAKAVTLIHSFQLALVELSGWSTKFDPSFYASIYYNRNGCIPLINRDSSGHRVFIITSTAWDPREMSWDENLIAIWLLVQYALAGSPDDQRNGWVTIWDLAGWSLIQLRALKHLRFLKVARQYQNGVIGRLKGFHMINHPPVAGILYAGLKPFFSEKIKKRVHLHSSYKSLHEHVDAKLLPTFLGGKLQLEECIDKKFMHGLVNSDNYFQDMLKTGFPSD